MPLTTTATPITIVKTGLLKSIEQEKRECLEFCLEADSISPTNLKRITTVYPNNTINDNQSLKAGTFLKTLNDNHSMISPPAKRRRSGSSTNHQQLPIQSSELTTLTLDQLKVQYGNVSVSIFIIFFLELIFIK
jgi:hypothetical protein